MSLDIASEKIRMTQFREYGAEDNDFVLIEKSSKSLFEYISDKDSIFNIYLEPYDADFMDTV